MEFNSHFSEEIKNNLLAEKKMTFNTVYDLQKRFQADECAVYTDMDKLPIDNPEMFKYHCMFLMEELGELIKTDKRWKHFRNTKYDREDKLSELADCFICLMNIALFSGFNGEEIREAVINKIFKNYSRLYAEKNNAQN